MTMKSSLSKLAMLSIFAASMNDMYNNQQPKVIKRKSSEPYQGKLCKSCSHFKQHAKQYSTCCSIKQWVGPLDRVCEQYKQRKS